MESPHQPQFQNLTEAVNKILRRQALIEERLELLERIVQPAIKPDRKPEPIAVEQGAPDPRPVMRIEPPKLPVSEPPNLFPVERGLESKVGLTLVNRVGVVTLVLGVAFFFKWAVDNDWIGQTGRVILGSLAGLAALTLADYLWRKSQQIFAQGITGAGIAILYLSVYAAFNYYHLVLGPLAMALMIAVTVLSSVLALRYDSVAIAALGMVGGYLAPLLLSTGEDHPWFLFGYLFLLNFASTELAARRKWALLELIGFVATALIYAGWLFHRGGTADNRLIATLAPIAFCAQRWRTTLPGLFATGQFLTAIAIGFIWMRSGAASFFALVLFLAAAGMAFAVLRRYPTALPVAFSGFWLSYLVWQNGVHSALPAFAGITLAALLFFGFSVWRVLDHTVRPTLQSMTVLALDAVVYFAAAYALLNAKYYGLGGLALLIAAAYFVFGFYLYRKSSAEPLRQPPALLAFGIALCFLTLAIPIQFTGFTVTIAWAIQAAAITWIGVRLNSEPTILASAGVFAFAIFRLAIFDSWTFPDPNAYSALANLRFFTFAVSAIALFFAARSAARMLRQLALAQYLAGHVILLWALSMEVVGWAKRSTLPENQLSVETVSISVIFGLYAVALVSFGVATRTLVNRLTGLVLIGFVILKLYFFDVWQLSRVYQISAFVALGTLLLSTSFLYSHFRRILEAWWKREKVDS